jgi:hypothetical protein
MNIHSAPVDRLRLWVKQNKKATYAIAAGAIVLIAGITTFALMNQKTEEPEPEVVVKEEPKPEPVKYYSLLTGEEVKNEAALTAPVTTTKRSPKAVSLAS